MHTLLPYPPGDEPGIVGEIDLGPFAPWPSLALGGCFEPGVQLAQWLHSLAEAGWDDALHLPGSWPEPLAGGCLPVICGTEPLPVIAAPCPGTDYPGTMELVLL